MYAIFFFILLLLHVHLPYFFFIKLLLLLLLLLLYLFILLVVVVCVTEAAMYSKLCAASGSEHSACRYPAQRDGTRINTPAPPVYGIYEDALGLTNPLSMTLLRGTDYRGLRTNSSPSGLGAKESEQYTDLALEMRISLYALFVCSTPAVLIMGSSGSWYGAPQPAQGWVRAGSSWRSLDRVVNRRRATDSERGSLAQRLQPSLTRYIEPQWTVIYGGNSPTDGAAPGFSDLLRNHWWESERCCCFKLTRQVFFQRFDYTIPTYGKTAPTSPFRHHKRRILELL